jgi:hypothetical protein
MLQGINVVFKDRQTYQYILKCTSDVIKAYDKKMLKVNNKQITNLVNKVREVFNELKQIKVTSDIEAVDTVTDMQMKNITFKGDDNTLIQAIKSHNEIMLSCNKAIFVERDFFKQHVMKHLK